MAGNHSSSDSSGGSAPLSSRGSGFTSSREMAEATKTSESPSDDEMALVRASNQFNQIANDNTAHRPALANDEYRMGHQIKRSETVRPPNGFHPPSPFSTAGAVTLPANVASSPLYTGFGDIQARLVTAQQYVRITPGFTNDQGAVIKSLLVGVGQDLTHFATNIIQEHTKAQHQAGELRVQYEKAQNELLSRRHQIADLQEQYKTAKKHKDAASREIARLQDALAESEAEVKRLQKLTKSYDSKHMKQMHVLEEEIKSLRMAKSEDNAMQLVKLSDENKQKHGTKENEDESDRDETKPPAKANKQAARRGSALNPAAPEFAREKKTEKKVDHSEVMLPLLKKYAKTSQKQTASKNSTVRPLETQDARAYETDLSSLSRGDRRPPTRMGHRDNSSAMFKSSRDDHARHHSFLGGGGGSGSSALMAPAPFPMSSGTGYKSAGDIADISLAQLQEKADWDADDVTVAFQRLFGMIEGLVARHHVERPYHDDDSMLEAAHPVTWRYIISMGLRNPVQSASHMRDLLSRFQCRHWVVKRIIVDYVIHRIIVPEVFFGFNDQIDGHLTALQARMKARIPTSSSGRPQGLERQRIVMDHAKVIRFVVEEAPEGARFREHTITKHVGLLEEVLRPMRSCTVEDDQARKALNVIVNAAWTITTKVWTSGMTLHFYFPETGSKFAHATMRALNYVDTPEDQMQFQQFRVMLVTTPTLSLRDDRDIDRLRTHELLKSDVLVMR